MHFDLLTNSQDMQMTWLFPELEAARKKKLNNNHVKKVYIKELKERLCSFLL